MNTPVQPTNEAQISAWHLWLEHPEKLRVHRPLFQIHLWVGMVAGIYLFVMSLTGSVLVLRNELERSGDPQSSIVGVVEWLVDLHGNLLLGDFGRVVNGIGAACMILLCVTGAVLWWPGITHWRRSLTINWKSSFARRNWEIHNALGFWFFLFVCLWGISGLYLSLPGIFDALLVFVDPAGTHQPQAERALLVLSNLHFGRFNVFTEVVWAVLGLVLAVLSFTGFFMCCHRMFVRKGAPLPM